MKFSAQQAQARYGLLFLSRTKKRPAPLDGSGKLAKTIEKMALLEHESAGQSRDFSQQTHNSPHISLLD
jgi:hypothetical protein